ncbi:hypothetical protein MELA_00130 [Candidatus Methylomirabilis lanthanidiphila]|uniref:Trypsin n=1 Tax=Candidatus Methylomirabilis lanthanidiphila TaxID=2211376 RepID=A0A564ZGJ4_9BACT|nr:hypothetical protein [Candidatus Methylomirabilis lanthanidiphila]VUZ83772.1 hypothetical protein MELA_00130 [Candidatus Methylomirabilis lanthanidiphila]
MDEVVLVKDPPLDLVEGVVHELAAYTIAFLRVGGDVQNPPADLLGSGVLVSAGTKRAILTAHHVVQVLPTTGRIGLFLGRTTQPHTIDAGGASVLKIGRGTRDDVGPDLAAIVLSPVVAGSIQAIKSFVNLDRCRDQLLNDPPAVDLGVWFAQGFLDERTTVGFDRTEPDLTKYFYNFTGMGGPDGIQQLGAYDYFNLPVSPDARATTPTNWGGMSGGGVWQVPFKREGERLVHLRPLLSGTMFYQQPTNPSTCEIRCHGRRSLYEVAYTAILGEGA